MAKYDLLIRNGTIVDGSGAEPYQGNVAILGDKIVAVGAAGSINQYGMATGLKLAGLDPAWPTAPTGAPNSSVDLPRLLGQAAVRQDEPAQASEVLGIRAVPY